MENENLKCVDHKISPENLTDDVPQHLSEEWDFWWPINTESEDLKTE